MKSVLKFTLKCSAYEVICRDVKEFLKKYCTDCCRIDLQGRRIPKIILSLENSSKYKLTNHGKVFCYLRTID